jgi:DNA-binding transcriptional ArsR family regulator
MLVFLSSVKSRSSPVVGDGQSKALDEFVQPRPAGEVPVGIFANHVGLSQSALSQHLSKLRAQKLVTTRRDAQTIYYSSSSEQVMKVLTTLESYLLRHRES